MRYYRATITYRHMEFGGFFMSTHALFSHLDDTPLYWILHLSNTFTKDAIASNFETTFYDPNERLEPCEIRLEIYDDPDLQLAVADSQRDVNENNLPARSPVIASRVFLMPPFTKGKIIGTLREMMDQCRNALDANETGRQEVDISGRILRDRMQRDLRAQRDAFARAERDAELTAMPVSEIVNDGIRRIDRPIEEPEAPEPSTPPRLATPLEEANQDNEDLPF